MIEFISSARRDLRLPIRIEAQLAVARAGHLGLTEDVGARGCRLLAPLRLLTGTRLKLLLRPAGDAPSLSIDARVVWRRDEPRWRHGLAFIEDGFHRSERWFDQVVQCRPELLELDRVPDQVRLHDRIYIARAPLEPPSVEEALLLRLAIARPTIADLRVALGTCWSRAQRALFSLLNSGVVALEQGGPEAPGLRPSQAAASLAT